MYIDQVLVFSPLPSISPFACLCSFFSLDRSLLYRYWYPGRHRFPLAALHVPEFVDWLCSQTLHGGLASLETFFGEPCPSRNELKRVAFGRI